MFLSVCRTVSRPMASTSSRSTSCSASRRSVQEARPAGAWLHAMARRRASGAPSSVRGVVRAGGWRARAVSSPSSTNRWRHRWRVDTPTSNASVICWSGQFGPSTSAFRSIRARSALSRATRGPATSCGRGWRSSPVNRTMSWASLPIARSSLRCQCGAMYRLMGQTCQNKVDTPLEIDKYEAWSASEEKAREQEPCCGQGKTATPVSKPRPRVATERHPRHGGRPRAPPRAATRARDPEARRARPIAARLAGTVAQRLVSHVTDPPPPRLCLASPGACVRCRRAPTVPGTGHGRLRGRLTWPSAAPMGLEPPLAGGFAHALALVGDQAHGGSRACLTIVLPWLAPRRTPPPALLSPFSGVRVY